MPYIVEKSNTFPPHIVEDDYWQEEWGKKYDTKLPYFKGNPIDSQFLPSSGYLEDGELSLPSFVPLPRWLCDEKVRDVIESVEPDVHRFHTFSLRKNEISQEVTQKYFTINVCNSLNVFDPEQTDPELFKLSGKGFVIRDSQTSRKKAEGLPIRFSVREEIMKHHHMVLDPRVGFGKLFLSDPMHDALVPYLENEYFWAFKAT